MSKTYFTILTMLLVLQSCKETVTTEEIATNSDFIEISELQFNRSKMELGVLQNQPFEQTVSVTGVIDVPPTHKASITSFLGGYVKSCGLQVGEEVKKGQTLLVLENTQFVDIQKDYIEVAQQIKYLKTEYERQKTLFQEKITSEKNYFKAESDYLQAQGMYQTLLEKLRMLNINPKAVEQGKVTSQITILAPISGSVSEVNAAIGAYVSPSDVILEIIDDKALQLELQVFEKDILNIKSGQKVNFKVSESGDKTYQATVHLVGNSIQNQDRSVLVYANLENQSEAHFIAGMFVEAKVVTKTQEGLALPKDAIWFENDRTFVLVLVKNDKTKNYSFKKTKVNLGVQTNEMVEILLNQGFDAQTKFLTKGIFDIQ